MILAISKIERVTAIFVGQGMTKSRNLNIFKSQFLSKYLRYESDFFLHMNINFVGLKITFSNTGSHGALSLISGGWSKWPPPAFSWDLMGGRTPWMNIFCKILGKNQLFLQIWDLMYSNSSPELFWNIDNLGEFCQNFVKLQSSPIWQHN